MRGMKNEQASRGGAAVPKRVCLSSGDQHERPGPALEDLVSKVELDDPLQDEVRLIVADVTVRRWHAPTRRQRPFHQREPALGVQSSGLEPHLAAASLPVESVSALPTKHSPASTNPDAGRFSL
jgi:hypothetical protein